MNVNTVEGTILSIYDNGSSLFIYVGYWVNGCKYYTNMEYPAFVEVNVGDRVVVRYSVYHPDNAYFTLPDYTM